MLESTERSARLLGLLPSLHRLVNVGAFDERIQPPIGTVRIAVIRLTRVRRHERQHAPADVAHALRR